MDISKYGKHGPSILIYLLDNGEIPITDFSKINIGPTTYYRSLANLEADGLVKRREIINRRKLVLFSLTNKGISVAKNLKLAQDAAEGKQKEDVQEPSGVSIVQPEEEEKGEKLNLELTDRKVEKAKYLKVLYHVNVLDDHITVEELRPNKPSRIFNIYIRKNGGGNFRLWCEFDDSYECWHVQAAWTYPQVQKMMTQYKGKVKVCPVCGFENPERAKFCMDCGAKLE